MSVATRLCILASLSLASVITACGSSSSNESCNDQNLCSAGLVCVDGQCQLASVTHTGGDGDTTDQDGDPVSTGGDDGDSGGGDGGDQGFTQDSDIPDTTGPDIVFTSPTPGQVVGGIITISLTANDPSGLKTNGVVAYVGSKSDPTDRYSVTLTTGDGSTFTGTFNTLTLDPSFTFPWVGARATDALGNETDSGFPIGIDNVQPRVGFSSYQMQSYQDVPGAPPYCSPAFSPLGTTAASFLLTDGEVIGTNVIPRLRIEDEGNLSRVATKQPGDVISGIDNTSAVVYFWHQDPSIPKFVSSTGGNHCDTINPAVLPVAGTSTPGKAIAYNLVPFTSDGDGAPDFQSGPPEPTGGVCTPNGTVTNPVAVCKAFFAANIYHWLTYTEANVPAVYGLDSYDPTSIVYCTGGIFDRYNLPTGPTCIAALVKDNAGNTAVTSPIAVCLDRSGTGADCTTFNAAATRAACSDGCTSTDWSASGIGEEVINK